MPSMSAYYVVKHVPTGEHFIVLKEVAKSLNPLHYDLRGYPTVRQFQTLEFIDTDEYVDDDEYMDNDAWEDEALARSATC